MVWRGLPAFSVWVGSVEILDKFSRDAANLDTNVTPDSVGERGSICSILRDPVWCGDAHRKPFSTLLVS